MAMWLFAGQFGGWCSWLVVAETYLKTVFICFLHLINDPKRTPASWPYSHGKDMPMIVCILILAFGTILVYVQYWSLYERR